MRMLVKEKVNVGLVVDKFLDTRHKKQLILKLIRKLIIRSVERTRR